jgi:cytochrome P450
LPSAIEEVLRYRSPIQWMMRTPRRDVEMHGQLIPAGALVLPMIGSANRDSKQFPDANNFDITRIPIRTSLSATASILASGRRSRAWRLESLFRISWNV